MWVTLRSSGDPSTLTNPLRSALQRIDSDLALYDAQTLAAFMDSQTWFLQVFGIIFFIFATGALIMASIGIYAVATHAAARRTREMGIRMALGANSAEILKLAMSRGIKQLSIGLVLGLAVAVAATRLMQTVLTNVSLFEPVVLGTVIAIIFVVGLTACWIPARRVTSLDPARVLREE
jgi:ABC-type antimicrobial peptide transport system permease subunit